MLASSKETRRCFLQQFATWSAVAGAPGVRDHAHFRSRAAELRGPQASGDRDSVEAGYPSHLAVAGGVDFDRRGRDSAAQRL
jgi:hypothetical protein